MADLNLIPGSVNATTHEAEHGNGAVRFYTLKVGTVGSGDNDWAVDKAVRFAKLGGSNVVHRVSVTSKVRTAALTVDIGYKQGGSWDDSTVNVTDDVDYFADGAAVPAANAAFLVTHDKFFTSSDAEADGFDCDLDLVITPKSNLTAGDEIVVRVEAVYLGKG